MGEQRQEDERSQQIEYKTAQSTQSPAQYLDDLQQRASHLQIKYQNIKSQLAEVTKDACIKLQTSHHPSTGLPLPDDPKQLIDDLASLQSARHFLQYLQDLQALNRHTEKLTRSAERAYSEGNPSIYLKELSNAVESFSQGISYVAALQQLLENSLTKSDLLQRHGNAVMSKVHSAGSRLRSLLSHAIQSKLRECSWPPPLVIARASSSSTATTTATTTTTVLDSHHNGIKIADANNEMNDWNGFVINNEAFNEIQHLFIIQLTLQRAICHKEYSQMTQESPEGPVLWMAEELASGVRSWLHHHFAEGLPTDRPDKPEWLFAATLKAITQCAPHAEVFHPCVTAHGMDTWYVMATEMARSIHKAALLPVLRSHVLPRLASMNDSPSWLHYADQAIRFERNYASLRGANSTWGDGTEAGSHRGTGDLVSPMMIGHQESTIELLFDGNARCHSASTSDGGTDTHERNSEDASLSETMEWAEQWVSAERDDAIQQIEGSMDAADAWHCRSIDAFVAGNESTITVTATHGAEVQSVGRTAAAADHEFYPPMLCETVLSVIVTMLQRGGYIYDGEKNKHQYIASVIHATLKAFRNRLNGMLTRAEQFDHLLDDTGLPKVGAVLCALHYIEHCVREPQGSLLAVLAGDELFGAAMEREAGLLSTLRRQWSYKVAKTAVDRFNKAFNRYTRDLSVFEAAEQEEMQPSGPSGSLLPAADELQVMLRALSGSLDSVIFRDVWKAMTLAVNYSMFNNVATEATFTEFGALQFACDVSALIGVFSVCTSRPAAHFKELRDACKLVTLGVDEARVVWDAVRGGSGAQEQLRGAGIRSLNAEQAASVLGRRVDLA